MRVVIGHPDWLRQCLTPGMANAITLTVTGGTDDLLTDNVVVTFTATAQDAYTPTNYTLGGGLSAETPAVTTSTLPSGSQLVTYTFPSSFALTETGTISFPFEATMWFDRPLVNSGELSRSLRCPT